MSPAKVLLAAITVLELLQLAVSGAATSSMQLSTNAAVGQTGTPGVDVSVGFSFERQLVLPHICNAA